jgi:predicted DNA-binding transcriptional regulator YafY
MTVNKNQMQRLIRLAGELKENRYPNSQNFVAKIVRDADLPECSPKTIQRDFKLLQDKFDCPLAYSREHNGYYLKHHGWNFTSTELYDEHEMLAAILGARLAQDIFPEPLKNHIRNAVDAMLANNNPDFLDYAIIKSLSILPGLRCKMNPDIFMTVFTAWQNHRALDITYTDVHDKTSRRTIEPHALVYYECAWYVKCICHLRNEVRNFAINRITSAVELPTGFEPDAAIINSVINDCFLEYDNISDIKILCAREIKPHIVGKPLHRKQNIETISDAEFILHIPSMPEHELFQWLLAQTGSAQLLEPQKLRDKVKKIAEKIVNLHTRT